LERIDSSSGTGLAWRQATLADLERIAAIGLEVHPSLPERPVVMAAKFRLFPAGCRVLERAGAVLGYAIAHPWRLGDTPALDRVLRRLPAAADALFLHDVAVLPAARGEGAAAVLLGILVGLARGSGLGSLALVAVYGTEAMWARHGFEAAPCAALAGYGAASYMAQKLPPGRRREDTPAPGMGQ
jgi:GNAT superfamily N-acetyltransferase